MRWQAGQYVIEWTHQTSYYAYRFGKEPLGSRPDFDSAAQALVKYHETLNVMKQAKGEQQ